MTLLDETKIQVDERKYLFSLASTGQGSYSLLLDDLVFEILALDSTQNGEAKSLSVKVNEGLYKVTIEDHRSMVRNSLLRNRPNANTVQEIRAPMPGKVVRIEVNVGGPVKQGTGLLVLEAMKMENEIKSTATGSVERIFVDAGRAVEKGEILLSIKPI